MHWVREEGFEGMRTLSVETGEQPSCPLCRQPVTFARKSKRGEVRSEEGAGNRSF